MTPSCELDPIKIITTSRAALPLRKCLNNCDSIRGKWCTDGRMGAEMRSVALWSGSGGGGGGVDVRYPPAGTAPVRLLVEAEASPAFLRRARVWAQCTACTKQEGGKARKEKKKKEKQRGAEEEEKRGLEEERQRKTERKRHKSSSGQEKPPTGLFVQRKAIRSNC